MTVRVVLHEHAVMITTGAGRKGPTAEIHRGIRGPQHNQRIVRSERGNSSPEGDQDRVAGIIRRSNQIGVEQERKGLGPTAGMAITRAARVALFRCLADRVAAYRERLLDVDRDDFRELHTAGVIRVGEAMVERFVPWAHALACSVWKLG